MMNQPTYPEVQMAGGHVAFDLFTFSSSLQLLLIHLVFGDERVQRPQTLHDFGPVSCFLCFE